MVDGDDATEREAGRRGRTTRWRRRHPGEVRRRRGRAKCGRGHRGRRDRAASVYGRRAAASGGGKVTRRSGDGKVEVGRCDDEERWRHRQGQGVEVMGSGRRFPRSRSGVRGRRRSEESGGFNALGFRG